jgi:hypothetical protein
MIPPKPSIKPSDRREQDAALAARWIVTLGLCVAAWLLFGCA